MVDIGCVAGIDMEHTDLAFELRLSHWFGVEYVRDATNVVAVCLRHHDCFDQFSRCADESREDVEVGIISQSNFLPFCPDLVERISFAALALVTPFSFRKREVERETGARAT